MMTPEMEGKKPYETPELSHWGSLQAITAGYESGGGDYSETGEDDPADDDDS